MTERTKIRDLLKAGSTAESVLIEGWVRTRRDARNFSFIEVNDGSCLANIQIVANDDMQGYEDVRNLTTGSSVVVEGALVASQGAGQTYEITACRIDTIQIAQDDYPLQKKRHTDEYLRTIAHLRPRTNKYGALMRIRGELSHAVHDFYRGRGFVWVHTPILTASDCEGAGEMFRVTTLDIDNPPRRDGKTDHSQDLFEGTANLTVSGQLEAEMLALALGDVYTFGPTFRAENSNTRRHAAEFWMIEPEMAFADLTDDMSLAEDFVKHLANHVLDKCADDLQIFAKFVDKELMTRLEGLATAEYERITYRQAIRILENSGESFEFAPFFSCDMQSEHERYLTDKHIGGPVTVYNYPKGIKAFYMRVNDDDPETVAAMDLLAPSIGELIGGSQREERYDVLIARMAECGIPEDHMWWYLDSRRFGSVPHAGFGLGFERMIMLMTGVTNIRDVIPFPRTPGNIEF
ncbi:MAG: asparagine--tRNA ligase [Pseudomonadota bacterium]|nr:asparagine--tRNA ligase [Pseudomonadota bacterium]